jgi:hypothetical protein
MTDKDKAAYEKLMEELRTMAMRLVEISDGGFEDMEGADATEFKISEILWCECREAARTIGATRREIRALMK